MPALFWLLVVALTLGVGVAAAWPWLQERSGQAPAPAGAPQRPAWVVPVALAVGGLIVALVAASLFPSFPVFILFLPLIWWQRRRRGPRPPAP